MILLTILVSLPNTFKYLRGPVALSSNPTIHDQIYYEVQGTVVTVLECSILLSLLCILACALKSVLRASGRACFALSSCFNARAPRSTTRSAEEDFSGLYVTGTVRTVCGQFRSSAELTSEESKNKGRAINHPLSCFFFFKKFKTAKEHLSVRMRIG